MIKIINYISAFTLRYIAVLTKVVSSNFRTKYNSTKCEIVRVNSLQFYLPENLISSVVIIEDKRFFQHSGIDCYSIVRALFKNFTTNRIEGASTIVQQLIRNIINERDIKASRKVREIMLAILIDKEFSKDEIIFAYLQTYRFGKYSGLADFCKNKNYDLNALSLADTAQIAARLKYPTISKNNYIKYLKRVRTIEKLRLTRVTRNCGRTEQL